MSLYQKKISIWSISCSFTSAEIFTAAVSHSGGIQFPNLESLFQSFHTFTSSHVWRDRKAVHEKQKQTCKIAVFGSLNMNHNIQADSLERETAGLTANMTWLVKHSSIQLIINTTWNCIITGEFKKRVGEEIVTDTVFLGIP